MGILGKALPSLLSGLLKEAMAQAMPVNQTLPMIVMSPSLVTPSVEVLLPSPAGPQDPPDQVDLPTPQQAEHAVQVDDANQVAQIAETDVTVDLPLDASHPTHREVSISFPDFLD